MVESRYFTILGLGSTRYIKYMEIPRFIDEKLSILGANKFYYRGEADEAKDFKLVINSWQEGIQAAMRKQFEAIK